MGKIFDDYKKHLKRLKNTVEYTKKTNNVSSIVVALDIFYSYILYGSSCEEYETFDFYNVSYENREGYLTKKRHDSLLKKNIEYSKSKLTRKNIYEKFEKYLNRKVWNIKKISYKEYETIALDKKTLIFNSNSSYDFPITLNTKDFRSPAFMQEKAGNRNFIEEYKRPNKLFNKINPNGVVIINVVTLKGNVVSSTIDLILEDETLLQSVIYKNKVKNKFMDKKGNLYSKNPINDESIVDFEVPKMDEIIETAQKLSQEIKDVYEIEWSFTLTDSKVQLLSARPWKNYDFIQKEEFINRKNKLYNFYKDKLKQKD